MDCLFHGKPYEQMDDLGFPIIFGTIHLVEKRFCHQTFQVPKMEGFLNLHYKAILMVGFPLHKPYPYSLYRWWFLHFR